MSADIKNIQDPTNITGVSFLIDPKKTDPNVDLADIEKEIISGSSKTELKEIDDPIETYKRELGQMSKDWNIDFEIEDNSKPVKEVVDTPDNPPSNDVFNIPLSEPVTNFKSNDEFIDLGFLDNPANPSINHSGIQEKPIIQTDQYIERYKNPYTPPSSYRQLTEEQEKQSHIENVIEGISNKGSFNFDLEKESEEDYRNMLLADIDTLFQALKADKDVDLTRIPEVNDSSATVLLERVHKILRYKNDRARSAAIVEDMAILTAKGMGILFNGKREFLGLRPNLVGYHNNVSLKMRKLKYDTSNVVSQIFGDGQMSSGTRLAFEFLPSMLLYAGTKQEQSTENLNYDDEARQATADIMRYEH